MVSGLAETFGFIYKRFRSPRTAKTPATASSTARGWVAFGFDVQKNTDCYVYET